MREGGEQEKINKNHEPRKEDRTRRNTQKVSKKFIVQVREEK
jgi:hypothetical protein